MRTTYRPGQWYLLAVPGALVMLPPEVPDSLLAALWDRLERDRSLAVVIDVVTEGAGGSLATLPSFAAAVLEGSAVRAAVRGQVAVRVLAADAVSHVFTGENVSTWSERFVDGATRVQLSVDGDEPGTVLPLHAGVVLASATVADLSDSALKSAPAAAATGTDASPAVLPAVDADGTAVAPAEAGDGAALEAGSPAAPAAIDGATLLPEEVTYVPSADEVDDLWGATVHAPLHAAAPQPDVVPPVPAAQPHAGDHDGATISVAEARALRGDPSDAAPDAATALLPQASGSARIRMSTGQVVALDRTVIIGRRPRSTRASGANVPHLVAVESPQQDISRSHLEIRPEGDTVVVIDLHTTNGSTLLRTGADPVRLHPGEQTLVLSGDVVDLGDGVTVTFEDLP